MVDPDKGLMQLQSSLQRLLDPVELSRHVSVAAASLDGEAPSTTVMYVKLKEDVANVLSLAEFLWHKAPNYALSRKRREELQAQISSAPKGDLSVTSIVSSAVRDSFLDFREKFPGRASEVGELLAYCVAVEQLGATQLAAKMALKTNSNMPVHGLDGIHAKVENGCLYVFFLESKLSASASRGAAEFAESVADFVASAKQYGREYNIVRDLGNLDVLQGAERENALRYFDVLAQETVVDLRERHVGVVLYSDSKVFGSLPAKSDSHPAGFYDAHAATSFKAALPAHQKAAHHQLTKQKVDPKGCRIYYVAVPSTAEVRKLFYEFMGYTPPKPKATPKKKGQPTQPQAGKNGASK